MAVAFVKEFTDAAAASLSTGSNVTTGNLILFFVDWDSTGGITLSSVGDNAGGGSNVYTQVGTTQSGAGAFATLRSALFWAKAKSTATLTITPVFAGGTPSPELYGNEWSGQDTSTPINTSNQGAANGTPSITITTTVDQCGVASFCSPTSSSPGTITGYTSRSTLDGNDVSTRTANKTPQGSETATYSTSGIDWIMFLVAIQPPTGADTLFGQSIF